MRASKATDSETCLDWLHRNCFREMLQIEHKLEERKVTLALKEDFTLEEAFGVFSESTMSRLNAQDIMQGFERLGVTCSMADAKLLIARYDADDDNRLGFWEFSNMFLPVEPTLRDSLERRKVGNYGSGLSSDTRYLLKQAFRCIIDAESMVESIRQQVEKSLPVTLR